MPSPRHISDGDSSEVHPIYPSYAIKVGIKGRTSVCAVYQRLKESRLRTASRKRNTCQCHSYCSAIVFGQAAIRIVTTNPTIRTVGVLDH